MYTCGILYASIPVNGLLGNWVRLDCPIAVSNWSYHLKTVVWKGDNDGKGTSPMAQLDDYHRSSKRILPKLGIKPATSCFKVRNTTD